MPGCLGLDYGLRRIGIAAGDTERRLAFAVTTHTEGQDGSVLRLLGRLVAEREVEIIVVGLPLTTAGEEADMARQARRFADVLRRHFEATIVMWDERYTSAEADRWLATRTRAQPGERDSLAAEIILQSYLDSLPDADPDVPDDPTDPDNPAADGPDPAAGDPEGSP